MPTLFRLFKKIHTLFFGKNFGRIPGMRRLHSFLYAHLRPTGEVLVATHGIKLWINASDRGQGTDFLLRGEYDAFETELIRRYAKPGVCAVDAGAHIGYFALLMARGIGSSGRVYAFEPEPKNFSLLLKNILENHKENVIAEQCALSDQSGMTNLFLDTKNLGNMSFAQKNIPTGSGGGAVAVRTVSLDEYVAEKILDRRVDFIKMDVQGAEGLVILGGWKTIERWRPVILMEFWPYGMRSLGTDPLELMRRLAGLGYAFFVVDSTHKTLKSKQPEDLLNLSLNRPEGKGWANIICQAN